MSFDRDNKVDIIDLLIGLLRDHEKKLDEISYRLEKLADSHESHSPIEEPSITPKISGINVIVNVSKWLDFIKLCRGSDIVAVKILDNSIQISSIMGSILFVYEEQIPSLSLQRRKDGSTHVNILDLANIQTALSGKLKCGLTLETDSFDSIVEGNNVIIIRYSVSAETTKNWLADQLDIDKSRIIEGELSLKE